MPRITPGPWKVHGRDTRGLPHSLVGGDTLIAKVYSKCYGDVEQENANAKLIAASPSLLAALITARNDLISVSHLVPGDYLQKAIASADSAIQQATE